MDKDMRIKIDLMMNGVSLDENVKQYLVSNFGENFIMMIM